KRLIATPYPGIKYGVPALSWRLLPVRASVMSLHRWNAARRRSGGPVSAIVWEDWKAWRRMGVKGVRDDWSKSHLCSGHKSLNWRVWSRLPRGYTSPTGPARTWHAKRWTTGSSLRLVLQRFAASYTM